MKKILLTLLIATLVLTFMPQETLEASTWKDYQTGTTLLNQGKAKEAIPYLERAASTGGNASYYRQLATAYEETKQYQKAADTLYKEAELHYKKAQQTGDYNTYFATLRMADRLNSEIDIFMEEQARVPSSQSLAKYEPESGMYIGAFIMEDEPMDKYGRDLYSAFNNLAGKDHSTYFTYLSYGAGFPYNMANEIKTAGAAYHIAMLPESGLSAVKDDAYLRQFARDAKASEMPIFLRFAGEMNGDWVKWNGNPQEYIRAFRTVSRVMKEEAPNVAMVWSPSELPQGSKMHDYYPGDDYVDWVGASIYSVYFSNGDETQLNDHTNPLDTLDYIYDHYADQKPIMVSEFAATHTTHTNLDTTDFAINKMNMLYQGAKLKYPRVKSIQWFSLNALKNASRDERKINNFSLTENNRLFNAYKTMIKDDYYLTDVENGPYAQERGAIEHNITPLKNEVIRENVTVQAFAKTYDPNISRIAFYIDGNLVANKTSFPYEVTINPGALYTGRHTLRAIAYDSVGKKAVEKTNVFYTGARPYVKDNQVVLYVDEPKAYQHGSAMRLLVAPYETGGRTLVPLRFISESMGSTVHWDQASKTITIKTGEHVMSLVQDSKNVKINGASSTIDVAPIVKNGTTLVPVRFISEQLGSVVHYESKDQKITISN